MERKAGLRNQNNCLEKGAELHQGPGSKEKRSVAGGPATKARGGEWEFKKEKVGGRNEEQ